MQQLRERANVDIPFYIVGPEPPPAIRALHDGTHTIVTGYVESLGPYIEKSWAFLAPMRYGAGVKGKITDAVCAGLPIFTTPIGNEGIGLEHGREAWICNSTEEFREALANAYAKRDSLGAVAQAALIRVLHANDVLSTSQLLSAAFCSTPVVVAIVTWNKRLLLERCLHTLLAKTVHPNYRIAIVSNGCTDGTAEMVRDLQQVHPGKIDLFVNEENKYFVLPNNQLIRQYFDRDILMLNNDVEITDPLWLTEVQSAAYTHSRIAAAGMVVVTGEGLVSEAGGKIFKDGRAENLGRGEPHGSFNQGFRYVSFVSGCCAYLRRDAIDRFGSLDESLAPMYYEDVEWQCRAHLFGWQTIFTPRSSIIHHEGSSAGTDATMGMKRYQEINRRKFLAKFEGWDLENIGV
jgi:GT2 family glycosyltransferase